ncbi:hypothetical protein GCM10010329_50770 [Streptomyces spiroverticillatus]|uniref:DUF4232 domain-containing protein n=1 Tax=Streptomyces finlayi TaxID=67296 RepID=A0A918X1S1_9ACTN|nr:DUF4232 domain-containing protein [Streptomyces finlayi]GHA21152.1 hypothetical protein GCM10010329_50770 [Streptomyces spiroverticillatus]GHD03640.1 hypothetical protein GCM10010334_51720 [Streptomyces finlayi]
MRLRTASLAAAALAAGLTLTACNDNGGTGTGSAGAGSSSAQPSEASASGGSDSQGTGSTGGDKADTGGSGTGKGDGKGTANGGSGNGGGGIAKSAACKTSALGFQVDPGGEPADANTQGHVTVTLTNKGTAPCTLNGYPGVDLASGSGDTWSLTRQTSVKAKSLTLDPGGDAYFKVTYLPYTAEGNTPDAEFKTVTLIMTPPGETSSVSLRWPHKTPVLKQDAATHPGTFVGPVLGE